MADAITRQVSEQVKRAMEVAGLAKPVHEGEPSHRSEGMPSLRPMERSREVAWSDRSDRLPTGWQVGRAAVEPIGRSARGTTAVSVTASTHYATHSRQSAWLKEQEQTSRPRGENSSRSQNARKYCEFHKQSGHTTTECRELKKALHELVDKGQIDRFLKRGPRFLRQEQTPAPPPLRYEECSTEAVAIIAGGYVKEITRSAWKAQPRSAQKLLTEVNLTGMIRLPVRFDDKNKFESLEVDFLLVDVPTAYNVIIKRPTLHRVNAVYETRQNTTLYSHYRNRKSENKHKQNRGMGTTHRVFHHPRALPPRTHWPQLLKDWWPRPQQPHPRTKEDRGPLQRLAHACPQSAGRPHNTGRLARPYGGIRGRQSGLASSPTPWLGPHQPWPSPADAVSLSFQCRNPLGSPVASHNVSDIERRAPPAAGTLHRPLPLW
ncbi:hypothetical protein Cgig2_014506 [Carnegiea gigantea]|uniref:Retrotransposon gag domain-containing protein n=1 Tax=Carnegiea gigantea TaxID=171969 RepID=A0A9Q1JZ14_9CARY|nr:hypothetical protein Cgig2_014506 [Carnegiea gigantea]